MSAEALAWVFQDAPDVKPHWVSALMILANDADSAGKGAHPTQGDLAWATRKDTRNVRECLRGMEEAGLIRKGDQRILSHYDADKRPVVWDLALERKRDPRPEPGRPGRPAVNRPDADIPPIPGIDRTDTSGRMSASSRFPGNRGDADIRPDADIPPIRPDADIRPDAGIPPINGDVNGHNGNRGDAGVRPVPPLLVGGGEGTSPLLPPQPEPDGETAGELTADEVELVAEVSALRPDWSPVSLRVVLVSAEIRERTDRALVRRAFLIAAADRTSTTPRRLLHERCPAWGQALAELYPPPPPPQDSGPGAVPVRGHVSWCRDPGCDETTRVRVNTRTGAPLRPQQRCPSCHPKSPAVAAVQP